MGGVGMRILTAIIALAVAATIVSVVSLVVIAQNPQWVNQPQPMPNALGGLMVYIINVNGSMVGLVSFNGQFAWGRVAVQLINPRTEYVLVAYGLNFTGNGLMEYIGYTYVNGSTLLSVIKGGLSNLYSWVRSEITLRPLNQYPNSSITIMVKSPSGELISNGTLCAIPVSAIVIPWFREAALMQGVVCVKVVNGIARLGNIPEIPYYLLYYNYVKLGGSSISTESVTHKVVNVYGVNVNVTEYTEVVSITVPSVIMLRNLTFTIPSNNTLTIIPRIWYLPSPQYNINGQNSEESTTTANESDPVSIVNSMNGAFSIMPSTSTSVSSTITSTSAPIPQVASPTEQGHMGRVHYELALVAVAIAVVTGFIAALVASRVIVKSGIKHE
ncbi:hypothetical protein [Caldivirga maquilingensis]|nr:hypothetical protein [Caldivirga maquilingensis]